MGERGPPPTPTPVLAMRGSWRANRNPDEPRPERGRPRCPKWLDEKAKEAWAILIPQLDRMGVLAKIDGNALARYCTLWSRWRKAEDFLATQGDTYLVKGLDGKATAVKAYPQARIAAQLPARIELRSTAQLNRENGAPLQRSLFDVVPADLNEYEKAVALVLDKHPQVLWWYRNLVGEEHFSIQGFRKSPVYPDFVVQTSANGGKPSARVLVIESKGKQLKGSEDTNYKRSLASLFEECGREATWQEISSGFAQRRFRFQVLDEGDYTGEEWRDALDALVLDG